MSPARCFRLGSFLALGVLSVVVAFRGPVGQDSAAAPADRPRTEFVQCLPHWPMLGGTPSRNMVNPVGRDIPTTWAVAWEEKPNRNKVLDRAKSKNVRWVAKLGTCSYGGPVVSGGKVYVGTNNGSPRDPKVQGDRGIVMCFGAADGEYLWQAVHDKLASGQIHDYPKQGVASTPIVVGDRLWYVSNRCELVCASTDARLGTHEAHILWKLDMKGTLGVSPHNLSCSAPLVVGDRVFVVTGNGVDEDHVNVPAPQAPSFLAVNRDNGAVLWQSNAPGKAIMHGQWCSPSFARVRGRDQVIFPGGDGWLRAFDPATGKLLWKFDANPKNSKYELGGKGTRSDFVLALPVVVDDRLYIGTGQDPEHYTGVGHLWCIDLNGSGDVSPELVIREKPLTTMPNPNSAVVWHYGGLATPAERAGGARDYLFGRTMSTVAVHDGLVYAAEIDGFLHCLDARTGKPYWQYDLKAAIWGSPYWVDGKVYLGTEDGDVWIFEHGKEAKVLDKIEMEQPIRTTPVVVDSVLYIMTETHLYAIAGKEM